MNAGKKIFPARTLWTTFLTTSLMGAGFSALELPNVASYAHKNHVLKTQEKRRFQALRMKPYGRKYSKRCKTDDGRAVASARRD